MTAARITLIVIAALAAAVGVDTVVLLTGAML
jgi:hypothetical protein